MTNSLPAKANIDLLKKQAKKLLKQYRSGRANALTTVKTFHPVAENFTGLRDAQLVVARSYGFKDWAELSHAVLEKQSNYATHHCSFCGESEHEVSKLVAGPTAMICDKCIDLCVEIKNADENLKPDREIRIPTTVSADPLILTDTAVHKIKSIIEEQGNPRLNLRVFVSGGGSSGLKYGFTFDNEVKYGDTEIEKDGVRLLVDPYSYQCLMGVEIDCTNEPEGLRFVVNSSNKITI